MFTANLLLVIQTKLREYGVFTEGNSRIINISPLGKPYPDSGEWFIGVSSIVPIPNIVSEMTDFTYDYEIVISKRTRTHSAQLMGEAYIELLNIADRCIVALNDTPGILESWAESVGSIPGLSISIYGRNIFSRMDPAPMEREKEWWQATSDHTGVHTGNDRIAGYSLGINFSGLGLAITNQCT